MYRGLTCLFCIESVIIMYWNLPYIIHNRRRWRPGGVCLVIVKLCDF